jgi:glycosyltransferase involved in cell wall biosynthesis
VRILLATDSFPPNCGGSGWSTWELATGLRRRGHDVRIVQPRSDRSIRGAREHDGFVIDEFPASAPRVPFVRNYYRNERLYPALAAHLARVIEEASIDIVHAQHVLTTPAAVAAARRAGVPVVATVRDYWPVCYWGTILIDPEGAALCPACTPGGMANCLRSRTGLAWPAALAAIPYMRANLQLKRGAVGQADAVIAVSRRIAVDLRARAPEMAPTRIEHIPNPFDIAALRQAAARQPRPLAAPYVVFAGKLEPNKGADLLVRIVHDSGCTWPVVVVGDGTLRPSMQREAQALGVDLRVTGWIPREQALAWLAGAAALAFPSRGPESLSRVLVEASALGIPIAALDTGGTGDVVRHGETGLLSATPAQLAADLGRLTTDAALGRALASGARAHAERTFDAGVVVSRIERLYRDLAGVELVSRG